MADSCDADKNIAYSSLLVFLSLLVGAGLAFCTTVVVARNLTVDEFGILSLFISLQGFVVLFASFGVPRAVAKLIPEYRVSDMEKTDKVAKLGLTVVLALSIATLAIYVSLSDLLGNGLYHDSRIAVLVPFSSVVVFSTAILSVVSGLAQGYQKPKIVSLTRVSSPFLSFLAILALLPVMGIHGVFLGYFVGQTLTALVALRLLTRPGSSFLSSTIGTRKSEYVTGFFRFSRLSFLSNATVFLAVWIGSTVLTLEVDLEAVGYFGIAYGFYVALILIPAAISVPFLPRISELSMMSVVEVQRTVVRTLRLSSSLVLPIVLAIGLFSSTIVSTIYGMQYLPAVSVVNLMLIAGYVSTQVSVVTTLFVGMGRMRVYFFIQLMWAVVFLISVLTLVPHFGDIGLGFSYALSFLGVFVVVLPVSRATSGIDLREPVIVAGLGTMLLSVNLAVNAEFEPTMLVKLTMLAASSVVILYPIMTETFCILRRNR